MITLEDQIRRYATDVAGPAAGEPPADLLDVTRTSHRGRWALVAALALFIAGLAYVATSSHDISSPAVTTPETAVDPTLVARPAGLGSCTGDGGTVGMVLEGSKAEGLCVTAVPGTGDLADDVYVSVYSNGARLIEIRFAPCHTPGEDPTDGSGASGPYSFAAADGTAVMIDPVAPWVTSVRLDQGPDPTDRIEAFDLEALRDTRLAVSRVAHPDVASDPTPLDAAGERLEKMSLGAATACLKNDGPYSVYITPRS